MISSHHPIQEAYEGEFVRRVLSLPSVDLNDVLYGRQDRVTEVQLRYKDKKDFGRFAKALKIMDDLRVSAQCLCVCLEQHG